VRRHYEQTIVGCHGLDRIHRICTIKLCCIFVINNNIPYLPSDVCNSLNVLIPNKRIAEMLEGRSSSPVGCGIGIAEVVGSNPTRSTSLSL
jgi:hypothetical protein